MAHAEWRSAVRVVEEAELAREIAGRLPPPGRPRDVRVTDLVASRRGFWRAVAPVPIAGDRLERVEAGRQWHRRLGPILARRGALEVRVRREGTVGRIDVLGDRPIEVKTSSQSVASEALVEARPDHVEQLAMYCALAGRSSGRLVVLGTARQEKSEVQVVDFEFVGSEELRAWVRHRADELRRAWSERRTDGLPACRWYDRGCEYRTSGVCDCRPTDPPLTDPVADLVTELTERRDLADGLRADVAASFEPETPVLIERFRDLLYPRRVYFERVRAEPEPPRPVRDPMEPLDLYERLTAGVEGGPVGDVARIPTAADEPDEEVAGFRGQPFVLKVSRARDALSAEELLEHQPQYALELGARCVATGTSSGRLFLGRERAADDRGRVRVYRFDFGPMSPFARWWRERRAALEQALDRRDPYLAPACPAWMYADCPYRVDCDCAAGGPRSQR